MSDAEEPAPSVDLLQSLPEPLRGPGKALIRALTDQQQVAQAFSTFCSAAYADPEWTGAASEFLGELFANQEDLLAEIARIPDLIVELASGHITLTCMVASRWAARAETPRLARLAEALIATQSKMSGDGVAEVMLALASSLAITRYSRAEQLVAAAEPHATAEQQEALAEARLWLAAGRMVRSCSQEARDLWDQRLRRPTQAWTWDAREEREALVQLADHLNDEAEGAPLFQAILPPCWWDLATLRLQTQSPEVPAHSESAPPAAPATTPILVPGAPSRPPSFISEKPRDTPPGARWSPLPFVAGVVLGALCAAVIFLLAQPHRYAPKPAPVVAVEAVEPEAAPPAPPAPEPTPANPENDEWRQKEIESLVAETPELVDSAGAIKIGTWAENEALLMGESVVAPRSSPVYQKLLFWMHLDPPVNAEVRAKIPTLLAALRPDDTLLELWKKLTYEGSANAEDIRTAAKQQIHRNGESKLWSEAQIKTLAEIAGWGSATSQ